MFSSSIALALPTDSMSRQKLLTTLQSSCEKNADNLKDRTKAVCTCVVRNHSKLSKTDELKVIVEIYNKKDLKPTKAVNDITDYDNVIAEGCVKDTAYNLEKRD